MKTVQKLLRVSRLAAICGGLLMLTACATASMPSQMVAAPGAVAGVSEGQPGYKQFRVGAVQGGSETNPMWMSNVSNADFKTALESSLRSLNYLADENDKAQIEVTASIVDLKRPMAGIDMSVTSKVRYSALPATGGAPVFDETLAATGTAKFGEALLGVERLRKANEAAVRANIEVFIQRLQDALKAQSAKS